MAKPEKKRPAVVVLETKMEPVTPGNTKIIMLKNAQGANDGITVKWQMKDKEYVVGESLATTFEQMRVCKKKGIKAALSGKPKPEENKAIEPEENKTKEKK